MRQDDIDLVCEECGKCFRRRAAEVKRNKKKGRRTFCSRKCVVTFENKTLKRRALRSKNNKKQIGDKNPNWKGGVSNSESVLKSRAKYPERWAARRALQRALENGKIERPVRCGECGRKGYITAHHEDYKQPLDVKWLCRKCHGKADRNLRKRGGL